MASKKRLYFLIIPAVCIYVTAVGFVIAGSASRSPSMPQKISQQDAEIDAAEQNPNSTNEIIITLSDRTRPTAKPEQTETKAEEKTSAVKTIFAKLNPNKVSRFLN